MIPKTWSIEIDESTGVWIVTVHGELMIGDFGQFLSDMRKVPEHRKCINALWDLRRVDQFPSTNEIHLLSNRVRSDAMRPHRLAIVVERDDHFGLSRMFEMLSEQPGIEQRVFRDYDRAQQWLTQPWTVEEAPWVYTQYTRVSF